MPCRQDSSNVLCEFILLVSDLTNMGHTDSVILLTLMVIAWPILGTWMCVTVNQFIQPCFWCSYLRHDGPHQPPGQHDGDEGGQVVVHQVEVLQTHGAQGFNTTHTPGGCFTHGSCSAFNPFLLFPGCESHTHVTEVTPVVVLHCRTSG